MKSPPLVLSYLLTLLAVLMGTHLLVLVYRNNVCTEYERILFERLQKVPEGSLRAREIRNEIEDAFSGNLGDCSRSVQDYSDASKAYLATILALLTGAGIGSVASKRYERDETIVDRLLDERDRDD